MQRKMRNILALLLVLSLVMPFVTFTTERAEAFSTEELKDGVYKRLDQLIRYSYGTPEDWITSGNYSYEFLDSEKKHISIRKIEEEAVVDGKLSIPGEIDGYKVIGIGAWSFLADVCYEEEKTVNSSVMDKMELIQELIVPEGVEFLGECAFFGCTNLKKIALPDSLVVIFDYALCGVTDMAEFKFSPGVIVEPNVFGNKLYDYTICRDWIFHPKKVILYSDCHVSFGEGIYGICLDFSPEQNTELHIRYHKKDSFMINYIPGCVKSLYVDKRIRRFMLYSQYDEEENSVYRNKYYVKRLVMNNKKTELTMCKDFLNKGMLKGLYTVKGAKSIKEAKKYLVPYYWKKTGKVKTVTGKKKNGKYNANWKKIETIVYKHLPNEIGEKYTVKKKPEKTIYKVYGKKKKNGKYHFIKTTMKKSIRSEYRYVKAVPVKEWL